MRVESKINLLGGNAYSSTGGIQAVNRRLVDELGGAGLLRSAHFLWDHPDTLPEEVRTRTGMGQIRPYGLNRIALCRTLAEISVRHPLDRWLCTHVNYGPLGLSVCRGGKRLGIVLHAAELDMQLTMFKRFALRRAELVIAVSEFTKKKAVRLGVRPERVKVVLNAVSEPTSRSGNAKPPISEIDQIVLFVGRMDERYKGQMELLDAAMLLRRRFPQLRLVFVGGGCTLSEWKAAAEARGLGDSVVFAGYVPDARLDQAYEEASVFAMPSENEGFGLVYAEAMARGLPCIGSDRDAAREVIMHGETGLCVPAGNSTALADSIAVLLKDSDLRRRMGEAGRERFRKHFTASAYRERLLRTMREWGVQVEQNASVEARAA